MSRLSSIQVYVKKTLLWSAETVTRKSKLVNCINTAMDPVHGHSAREECYG